MSGRRSPLHDDEPDWFVYHRPSGKVIAQFHNEEGAASCAEHVRELNPARVDEIEVCSFKEVFTDNGPGPRAKPGEGAHARIDWPVRWTSEGEQLDGPREEYACVECGMMLYAFNEFHPYAACQVFVATDDTVMVWAVIKPMLERGEAGRLPEGHEYAR